MRVPLEWLRELVEFEDSPEGLAERLTFSGIEVEGIERVGADLSGVIVAEVRSVEQHPHADRLTVCRVWDGTSERTVVCGAPNVRPGGRYALATPGAKLPNGLTLRVAKIRGVESHGMLCAEDELGLSADHTGLLELPPDSAPGKPLVEILGGPDVVLDLEITPNRPDCLSLLGVAREVAALYRRPLRVPTVEFSEADEAQIGEAFRVEVRAPDLCPRYTARWIRGLTIGPSPRWMQTRLSRAGIRPINNVVDITNYVLLELGQPLHAFDAAQIQGRLIQVRRAMRGETLRTLDAQTRELDESMLVIADAAGPVALAGVMGGDRSAIAAETREILLESASFSPPSIRTTSRRLGLTTESSYRFARGVDPELADVASRRACALLVRLAGGRVARGAVDHYPQPVQPRRIELRMKRLRGLLGISAAPETVAETLSALGLEVQVERDERLVAQIPSFRSDLRIEADLVEEFARLHGLEHIPAAMPSARVVPEADDRPARATSEVREVFRALGLFEVMNYSLTAERLLDRFGLDDPSIRVRLPNPISIDQAVLRTSLLPQMVETLGRNRTRQVPDAALVEFGRVFARRSDGTVAEEDRLAVGLMGSAGRGPLARRPPPGELETFRWLKGILEAAAAALRAPPPAFSPAPAEAFEAGLGFEVRFGPAAEAVGRAGIVRRSLTTDWKIYEPVAVAELKLQSLTVGLTSIPLPVPPPQFPCTVRDLALLVPREVRHEQVLDVMRRAAPPLLERIELFDVFEGAALPPGTKSMAYSLTWRATDRTITDDEVQRAHMAVAEAVVRELGARIRASC
ncbi:MAG: phenylalanine--tRNA ligase subunit beta [Kiritimatiellae bacterium]|nr:phenylalanine--tRNA ligase subunit beta [Kiritimatiellia bacterium]